MPAPVSVSSIHVRRSVSLMLEKTIGLNVLQDLKKLPS